MNKKNNIKLSLTKTIIFLGLIIISCVSIFYLTRVPKESKHPKTFYDCDHIHYSNLPIDPSDKLNDKNDIHLLHAQKNGLKKPFETNEQLEREIKNYTDKYILVKVEDNQLYHLKTLKHSHPYLIPEAVDMLNEIAYRFREHIKEKKLKNYSFVLTSLLRTEETQQQLTHRNGNATEHSAHLYGTTVDISYKNFYNLETDTLESSWEAIQELTKTLIEMRKECKLLAVRERKQSCFHITVVVCTGKLNEDNKETGE